MTGSISVKTKKIKTNVKFLYELVNDVCLLNDHCKEAKSEVCSIEHARLAKTVGCFDFGQVLCALECLDKRRPDLSHAD